jgi:phosphohistidine phosphatase SixA
MAPELALKELQAYSSFDSVLLVGHEPDLSGLIATLLGIPRSESLDIKKASLTAITLKKIAPASGRLDFMVPCELLNL